MSATLDYEIKKALSILTRGSRWNVLTVLILHANIRNRCWVSMETVAEMATNGNRNKATAAKRWLERHRAFELVAFEKRVKEELKLSPRQHVYQLSGTVSPCGEAGCDCEQMPGTIHYLYQVNRMDGETIEVNKNMDGDTFKSLNGHTFNRMDGETISIPNEVSPNEVIKDSAPNGAGASKSTKRKASENPEQAKAIVALIEAWLTHSGTIQPTAYKNKTMRAEAAAMLAEGITPKHIEAYIKSLRLQDFWKDKAITWRKLAGEIKGFVHARPVIVSENPPAPVQERATPETVISLEEQAAARALFEQLVQSKVANDG